MSVSKTELREPLSTLCSVLLKHKDIPTLIWAAFSVENGVRFCGFRPGYVMLFASRNFRCRCSLLSHLGSWLCFRAVGKKGDMGLFNNNIGFSPHADKVAYNLVAR